MTTKIWNGSSDPITTAADWTPAGAPVEGDVAIIGGGSPSATGTLNGYEIDIAGKTLNGQPMLTLTGATLGTFQVLSLGEASGVTAYATVIARGAVTNNGFISAPTTGGMLTINQASIVGSPGSGPDPVAQFRNNGVISATGGRIFINGEGGDSRDVFLNDGTVGVAGGGEVDLNTLVSGTGRIVLQGTATVRASQLVSSGQTVQFNGDAADPERLVLTMPDTFGAELRGLGTGDSIDVSRPNVTGTVADGRLNLATYGFPLTSLDIGAGYTTSNFTFSADGTGGTLIGVVCYARGTCLLTAAGERPVEQLQPGDTVTTLSGEEATIRWVGHRRVNLARHPEPASVCPVRIAAHAFEDGMPRRDLLVSPEHALFVDGVLIPARSLLNGSNVTQDAPDAVEYFHVELDRHNVLLAEGMPAESYLDTGNRTMFANAPAAVAADSMAEACAPLVLGGAVLETVRARLDARGMRRAA